MSMCDEPPHKKNKMVLLAVAFGPCVDAIAAGPGMPKRKPAKPRAEATRNVRRFGEFITGSPGD
jgi:hypothetical protein